MVVELSSIDKSENRSLLREWTAKDSQVDPTVLELNTEEINLGLNSSVAINVSTAKESGNLNISIANNGEGIFSGFFNIEPAPVIILKTKDARWIEVCISSK